MLCSFANTNDEYKPMIAVVDALDVDWSNASVGFHCYQTGGTSAPIVATRERYPVICTEVDVPVSAGGDANVVPMDGEDWPTQTLERLGISWFAWRANGPEELERHFRGRVPRRRPDGSATPGRRRVESSLLQARARLQRACLRTNECRAPPRQRRALLRSPRGCSAGSASARTVCCGAFIRSGMAAARLDARASATSIYLVVLDDLGFYPPQERRAALAFHAHRTASSAGAPDAR